MLIIFFTFTILFWVRSAPINTFLKQLVRIEQIQQASSFIIKNKQNFVYQFEPTFDALISIKNHKAEDVNQQCKFTKEEITLQYITESHINKADHINNYDAAIKIISSHKLIYLVTNNFEITVYSYNSTSVQKISSHFINIESNMYNQSKNPGIFMLSSFDETHLYIFSIYKVWRVQINNILNKIDEVSINFNDRFISGFSSGQFLFLVNPNNGVYAYSVNMKYQIGLFEKINTSAGKNKIHGVDVFMSKQKFLYVLDQVQNIYVYKLQGKSFFLYDIIQIKHEQNFKIQVVENTIFYSFIEKDIDMICELYYNPTKKVAELVRYYKLFQRINQFFINSKQLFVLSQEGLDIFPINIDPRIIKRQHNGYKIDINANQIIKLTESQYLIHSKKKMKIARLIRKNPKISCHFSNLHQKIYINYKVNLSDCKNHPVMILNQNITYNSYCAFEKNIILDIDIPQIKQRKNIVVYGITIFVVILCILGVIFLFYWRHTRLNIIQRIKKQVNEIKFEKFKNQEEINQPNQLQDNLKTQQVMKKQSE